MVAAFEYFRYVEMFLALRDEVPVPFAVAEVLFVLNFAPDDFKLHFPRFLKQQSSVSQRAVSADQKDEGLDCVLRDY